MLVHICCSVDSHYFLQKLKENYPDEPLIGFFYDPNIHPYSEYRLRLLDVERSCKMLNIELIEGEYDIENWLNTARGLENEPEKGLRCAACFDFRFFRTAQKAKELGEEKFTSTLLMSPKKSIPQLLAEGVKIGAELGIEFIAPDYRIKGGTGAQMRIAKEAKLYHQNYCGCGFGLTIQREHKTQPIHELFNPINREILEGSIEERIELYTQRVELESQMIEYRIIKQNFLNFRTLYARFVQNHTPAIAHVVRNSKLNKKFETKILFEHNQLFYLDKHGAIAMTLKTYNELTHQGLRSTLELIFSTHQAKKELHLRELITQSPFSLQPIFVLDHIEPNDHFTIHLNADVFDDTREFLVTL